MASTKLSRTFTSGNTDKWTFSTWIKKAELGSGSTDANFIFCGYADASNYTSLHFDTDDTLHFYNRASGGAAGQQVTSALFRDPAAWYHLVCVWDSGNASSTDRMKLYVNGEEVTAFAVDNAPTQDLDSSANVSGNTCYLGTQSGSNMYFNGVLTHSHFCDGQAYAASDFGETDSTSGIWVAKTSPSVTYGTNGFFLKYASGASGTDSSGEGNNMTVSGTLTNLKDTPDNNFCTMNPLEKNTSNTQTFSNGNTTAVITAGYGPIGSTMSVSKGKWYAECHIDSTASSGDLNIMLGINGSYNMPNNNTLGYSASAYGFYLYNGYMLNNNTGNSNTGGTQYWTSPGGGIVDDNKYWALALDCDNNKLYVRLDGTWLESADPSAGTGGYSITAPASTDWGCYRFANGIYFGNTNTFKWNFGNGFFGTTSAGATNADSDGYGVFKYSVPTGFKALCTAQLATYG